MWMSPVTKWVFSVIFKECGCSGFPRVLYQMLGNWTFELAYRDINRRLMIYPKNWSKRLCMWNIWSDSSATWRNSGREAVIHLPCSMQQIPLWPFRIKWKRWAIATYLLNFVGMSRDAEDLTQTYGHSFVFLWKLIQIVWTTLPYVWLYCLPQLSNGRHLTENLDHQH